MARAGITPPDLAKDCTYAEHIVHARGKRASQFTSVSLDLTKIRDFGDANYKLEQRLASQHGHTLVEHERLVDELRKTVRDGEKAERLRAARALGYAGKRKEGLVQWSFDTSGVERKDLITWAETKVQAYFTRL